MMGNNNSNSSYNYVQGEYRIFTELEAKDDSEYFNNFLSPWKSNKSYVEERIDMYVFPLSTESDFLNNYGLKFRDIQINENANNKICFTTKTIELKFRNKIINEVEGWGKFSINIKKLILLNSVDEIIESDKYYVYIDNQLFEINLKNILDIIISSLQGKTFDNKDKFLNSFKDFPLGFALTFKSRINEIIEEALIKLKTFKILESNIKTKSNTNYMKSFCLEGYIDNKSLQNFKENYEKDFFVAGYPQAILKYI
jgi:hypothetical protein